ncbi:MAG TPA: RDD family protein [Longimicrobium sp.]|nr:RDD family protein [Longimicrobium sp.]
MNLAPRGSRFLGQFVDGIIAISPFMMLVIAMPAGTLDSALGETSIMVAMALGAGYYLFADAMPGGQSAGKLLLGMAVVNQTTHAPCTLLQSFLRNVLQPFVSMLDWIFIFGSRRQRLGDMLAGTIVVEKGSYTDRQRMYAELDRA